MGGAIKAAKAGQVQLPPDLAVHLIREVEVRQTRPALTRREAEVLGLLARGWIGQELHLRQQSVKSRVRKILGKLGVAGRPPRGQDRARPERELG